MIPYAGERERGQPPDRRDLDDPPRALLTQNRQCGLSDPQRTEDIDLDLPASLLLGELLNGARNAVARVVDNDIETPEAIVSPPDGCERGVAIGDIERGLPYPVKPASPTNRPPASRRPAGS
ncbi:MAG: hypothetical protein WBQ18_15130, partial [Solirubrobacteraceae bacterium]